MITQELIAFIKKELVSGKTQEQVKSELISQGGWSSPDIEEGFKSVSNQTYSPSNIKIKNHSSKKILFLILLLFIFTGGAYAYYFRGSLINLFISRDVSIPKEESIPDLKNIIGAKDIEIEQDNLMLEKNDPKTVKENQQPITTKENIVTTVKSPIITTPTSNLKPYQVRFIAPENNKKVILNGSVNLKIQVGEKIKKVRLSFITYNLNPENNPKDIEIPVQSGYASHVFNVQDSTLIPISIMAEGIADDMDAYTEAGYKLTEKEASEMFRTIVLYTDKTPDAFTLENKNDEVNYILLGETDPAPQFLAGFPGLGLIAIFTSDIEFSIADPSIIQILKGPPVLFKALKEGSTRITATYKGFSQEIYVIVN